MTAAFSLMGVGMAIWQGDTAISGAIRTGNVEVGFTDHYGGRIINPTSSNSPANASINRVDDQRLEITIKNAFEGLKAEFYYEIVNTGTMPVKITDYNIGTHGDVILNSPSLPDVIYSGNSVIGNIAIEIKENVTPEVIYTFSVGLKFEPVY